MKISQKFVCILLLGLLIFASANTVSSDQNKGDIGKDSILNNDSELCKFLFYDNKGTSIKVVFPEELINIIDIEKTVESNNEVSWSDTEQIFILNEEHNGTFKIWFKERITKDYIIQVIDKENKESFKLKKDEVQICKDVLDTEELKDKKTDSDTALEEINSETSDNSKSTGKQEDGVSYVLGAFSIKEKEEHTGENKGKSVSISNKFSYTLGVKLSEERQNVVPQLSFTSVSPENYLNKPSIVNTVLNNTPVIAKNLDFDINIYKNNKIFYHTEEKGKSMAPYSYYNIHTSTQNKELKPGKYMVDMKVEGEGISFKTLKYFIVEKEQAKVINEKAIGLDKKPFNLLYIVVIIMILCTLLVILFVLFIRKNKISKSKK